MGDITGIRGTAHAVLFGSRSTDENMTTIADLFCGAGTFTLAAASLGFGVGYAYEPDGAARAAYAINFGEHPVESIGDGFTDKNRPPKILDLVMCRFPHDTTEFDHVALRFLRYCQPKGILFVSPHRNTINMGVSSADAYEQEGRDADVIKHAARRMDFLGYATESHLLTVREEGKKTENRRALVGFQQKTGDGSFDFPWDEVAQRINYDAQALPPEWTPSDASRSVSATAAKALLGTLACFVLGVAGASEA